MDPAGPPGPHSQEVEMIERPVTTAKPGTPCGYSPGCDSHRLAVHVLTQDLPVAKAGTALCAFHSPFDPTDDERAEASPAGKLTEVEAVIQDQLHWFGAINLKNDPSRDPRIQAAKELVRRGIAVETPGPSGYLRFALVK